MAQGQQTSPAAPPATRTAKLKQSVVNVVFGGGAYAPRSAEEAEKNCKLAASIGFQGYDFADPMLRRRTRAAAGGGRQPLEPPGRRVEHRERRQRLEHREHKERRQPLERREPLRPAERPGAAPVEGARRGRLKHRR
jgi:hypothetical protein